MKNNYLKMAFIAITMLSVGALKAQSTGDVAKTGTAIKLVDNKGTIKYFQANNGITQIVNTTADVTTTTWQLGGLLSDDTTLTLAGGKKLKLAGLTTITSPTTAGLKVLVQDATGGVQEILVADLMQVQSGQVILSPAALGSNIIAGLPATVANVSVYRNGAKLTATVDYTTSAGALAIVDRSAAPSPQDWKLYPTDVVEVHWVK